MAAFERHLSGWLDKRLREITREMVIRKHSEITKGSGPEAANKIFRQLKAIYNKEMYLDASISNPVIALSHLAQWNRAQPASIRLEQSHLPILIDGIQALPNDIMQDYLLTLLFSGLRRSEAIELRWQYVNLEDGYIDIPMTKNGRPFRVHLSTHLTRILRHRRDDAIAACPWVFPGKSSLGHLVEPKTAIKTVCKRTGLSFSAHDLRRLYATIAEETTSYATAKQLLNHSVTDVTARYARPTASQLRNAAEEISFRIARAAFAQTPILSVGDPGGRG